MFASYEHFWTPSLRTSLYGSYLNISRGDGLNNAMCASGLYNPATVGNTRATGCDLDSSQWNIGSRSQWNITKDLYVGVDFIYHKVNTATYNAAGISWGARWSSPPPEWFTASDAGGEHWVCSVTCARKVDTMERARQVLESGEGRAKSGAR